MSPAAESPSPPLTLLGRLRAEARARRYSPATEQCYVAWVRRFVHWSGRRHPREPGAAETRAFLDHLVSQKVAASTNHQALCALVFLYRNVLELNAPWIEHLVRPRRVERVPIVLTREEVRRVLGAMNGVTKLMASLLYGSGLRLKECARLRVKDIDFGAGHIVVRNGKGAKDRITLGGPSLGHSDELGPEWDRLCGRWLVCSSHPRDSFRFGDGCDLRNEWRTERSAAFTAFPGSRCCCPSFARAVVPEF